MDLKKLLVLILIITSGICYYQISNTSQTQTALITRIVDGDTMELENSLRARLKGINCPEKSMPYYQEAGDFLKDLAEGKTIELEIQGADIYNRLLVYAYYDNKLINKEILNRGLAHLYYYEKDSHYNELEQAEVYARQNNLGIWEKSSKESCVNLIKLQYQEQERCNNQEQLILQNNCNEMQIIIKDDATHIYRETIPTGVFTKNFSCIWNDEGDSLYVWDEEGLILFWRY